ncbi:MAG TPA: hypothetical protein VF167_08455 [Longimicrobiaceae bacterium]
MQTIHLDDLMLASGAHGTEFCGQACAVEVSNLIAAGVVQVPPGLLRCERPLEAAPFADDHPSISRVIRSYVIGLNDAWNDADRQRLRPYAARILCTATGEADEEIRAWMATDWLVRVHTPAFLRLAGLEEHARALESLARITDATTARAAQPALDAARSAADAAWDAAWAAGWDAGWAAGWDAARAAAWAAARAAARDAARGALRPTVEALQASALELLDSMIEVGAPAGAEGVAK